MDENRGVKEREANLLLIHELLGGSVDVIVCDGFLANVVPKMLEGVGEVFADVADITGEVKYLEVARRISHRAILDPLIGEQDLLTETNKERERVPLSGIKSWCEDTIEVRFKALQFKPVFGFYGNRGRVFAGNRCNSVNPHNSFEIVLDLENYSFFHLLGRCARIEEGDIYEPGVAEREERRFHPQGSKNSKNDHSDDNDVYRHVVFDKIGYNFSHELGLVHFIFCD